MKKIKVIKRDSLIALTYYPVSLLPALSKLLTYSQPYYLRGRQLQEARRHGLPIVRSDKIACYTLEENGAFVFNQGFWFRVAEFLKAGNYQFENPYFGLDDPRWESDWEALVAYVEENNFSFRPGQLEVLSALASNPFGRIDCPTGWGKTTLFKLAAVLFPNSKIDFVCPVGSVIRAIHKELHSVSSVVGLIGAGKTYWAPRLNCYCAASLQRSLFDADIVLCDEGHKMGSDLMIKTLTKYGTAKLFSFSASHERPDNKHFELEGLFGPIVFSKSFGEAADDRSVASMQVHWHVINNPKDPCRDSDDRDRYGIWLHDFRNQKIAAAANFYRAINDNQCLVYCRTMEHAMQLRKYLKWPVAYNPSTLDKRRRLRWQTEGILTEDIVLDDRGLKNLEDGFVSGTIRQAICTPVWDTGLDFRGLNVLLRADSTGSSIVTTQVGGRAARVISGVKDQAIIVDFWNAFNTSLAMRSKKCFQTYAKNGWKQYRASIVGDKLDLKLVTKLVE